jgi:DNA topoisomerase-1
MAKSLVIVESPAKAKTLARFLGAQYRVEASFGHIRDLPESASEVPKEVRDKTGGVLGVNIAGNFEPYYVIPHDKLRHIKTLKAALKDADELLLATDPDREGESISWHLKEVLKPNEKKTRVRRIAFHEITEEAVREAIEQAHEIDLNLVDAQESRRILDRLFGYTLSPVLWKKVKTGLSAGRVQSIAVRLVVEREEARRAFRTAAFWDVETRLTADGRQFVTTLARVGDKRVASGKDFDASTGLLQANGGVRHLDESAARTLVDTIRDSVPWNVTAVDQRPVTERPAAPFTTSTLTQEASRKLGFTTARTMRLAQRLKDGVEVGNGQIEGLITYHRTDSTTLSEKALHEAARVIRSMFGDEYYGGPRRYQTKVRNAQEAHEAIRPTDFRLAPQQLVSVLEPDELRLYELIWKRTMASQMPDARLLRTTVEITAKGPGGEPCAFTATGKAIEYPGYRRAYVEGSDDPESELEDQETILPVMREGDPIGGPNGRAAIAAARHRAAGALHRGVADQETRGGRHRPAVHVRADHRDDPAARLRFPSGQGAGAQLHGVCGHRSLAQPLRRLRGRRLHREDGGKSRRDLERRARSDRLHPLVLPGRRPSARSRDRSQPGRERSGLPGD